MSLSAKRVLIASHASLFPPEHGGAKNVRHLVESFARKGVQCRVLVKMHPSISERIRFAGQHQSGLQSFQIGSSLNWNHLGVNYQGIEGDSRSLAQATAHQIEVFHPDAVFLSDDSLDDGQELFQVAAQSGRLIFLAQTVHSLAFGPYAMKPSASITESVRKAVKIFAPSLYVKKYIETHLKRPAEVFYPNVFGQPPYATLGSIKNRYITMINPCPWKGSSILIALAKKRPDLQFACVPTWGATPPLLQELRAIPNLTLLEETSDIDRIFEQTRILIAPSLCQEAFGLVSPEALLRGIPVVASDIAGLRESTLGVAKLISVTPLPFDGVREGTDHTKFVWAEPENPIEPWSDGIDEILEDESNYRELAIRGKIAAEKFVASLATQRLSLDFGIHF